MDHRFFLFLCVGVVVLAVAPILLSHSVFSANYDTTYLTSPMFCEIGRHFDLGGMALFDWTALEPFSYVAHLVPLYPFYFAGLLDYCHLESAIKAHDLVALFHLGIMFGMCFVLARTALLGPVGAAFAALTIVASANAFLLARYPTLIAPAAWLPLAAAGLVTILHREAGLRGIAMLSGGIGLMLLASPATNLMASLEVFILVLAGTELVAAIIRGQWRRIGLFVACGVATVIIVALLAIGTTGTLLLNMGDLIRWTRTGYLIGWQAAESGKEILTEQQSFANISGLFAPLQILVAGGRFYIGVIVFGLASIGAWTGMRERNTLDIGLATVIVIAIFLVFLDPWSIAEVWNWIPGLSQARHLSLLTTPLLMAVALLAGRGLEALFKPEADRLHGGFAMLLVGLTLCGCYGIFTDLTFPPLLALPALVAPVWLGLAIRRRGAALVVSRPLVLAAMILAANAVAVLPQLYASVTVITDGPLGTRTWGNLARIVGDIDASDPDPGTFVFDGSITSGGQQYTTAGTAARLQGQPTFQYYLSPRNYWKFFAENYQFPDYRFYADRSGRYLISQGELNDPLLKQVAAEGNLTAYRIQGARQRVVALCTALSGAAESATPRYPGQLRQAQPGTVQAVLADFDQAPCPTDTITEIRVSRADDSLRFHVAPAGAKALVVNLPPYRDWHLWIGGRKAPLLALDDSRMIAVLTPGQAGDAVLAYRPGLYLRLLAISGGSGLMLGLFSLWLWLRAPRLRLTGAWALDELATREAARKAS